MKNINSQAGFLTIDFMFALTIAMGFAAVLFVVSFSLSMVEVGQYVTFAASRAYNGAHATESQQQQQGEAEFKELTGRPVLAKIISSGWIVMRSVQLGNFSEDYADVQDNEVFAGAQVQFESKILNIKLPFLGSTAENSATGKATLNSYLLREPSDEECREFFNRQRYAKLRELNDAYRNAPKSDAVLVTDNGC